MNAQKNIPIFFEKVYLHTDRDMYAGGDNIWFKAYIINPRTNSLSNASNNLYVELFDAKSNLVKREIVRMEEGVGKGDFKLMDSAIAGMYHLRAYTNWMKNFGTHFYFEKDIQVVGVVGKKNSPTNAKAAIAKNSIQFFPEGGTLVADVSSIVAFKALNENGKSTEATGTIVNDKGETVTKFATTYAGMGVCNFVPKQDVEYKAIVSFKDGSKTEIELPTVYSVGYGLSVQQIDTSIVLNIAANNATIESNATKEILIAAKAAGKIIYKEKFSIKAGSLKVALGKSVFPNGISAITLYNEKLVPYAERLVYVENKNQQIKVSITTDKTVYQNKEKTTIDITTTNGNNEPVAANLSLAVVDNNALKSFGSNILSYINLESEIKGNIENPASYFDTKNAKRFEQLDLLLRTQGWRDFLWKQLADSNFTIKYFPETGISLAGNVKATFGKKPLPNMNVTLIAPNAKGDKIYFTKTDSSGQYFLDGLPLYGSQTIKINSKNDKGKRGGIISLNDLNTPSKYSLGNVNNTENSESQTYMEAARKRWELEKKSLDSSLTLEGVTVKTTQKPTLTADGTLETNFGYSFSAQIKPEDKEYGTLENYLIKKTSASPDAETESVTYMVNGKNVKPRFRVDNREDVFERIDYYAIPIDQVISVTVNQTLGNNGGELSDRIWIHLTLKPGAYNQDLAAIMDEVIGYYQPRVFYAPSYLLNSEKAKKDNRTTIYWEPNITTNYLGKASLHFFNPDLKVKVNINVQGVGNKGNLANGTASYEIK